VAGSRATDDPTAPDAAGRRAVDRRILALALPATASLLATPLYDLTDTAILGHLGTTPLAGAVIANEILLLASSVFIFLMFGTTAAVARMSGLDRRADAVRHGVQGMWLGAGLGALVAVLLAVALPALVPLWGGHGAVGHAARVYGWVSVAGFPAALMVMAGTGYLRGGSNTVTPLWIALGTVSLNLVLEVVTIYGFGWGVAASAASTVVAQWVAAGIHLRLLVRAARRHDVPIRPHPETLRGLGSTGLPLFVRTAALRGVVATSVALAGRYGPEAVAGYGIAFGIWSFLAYLSDGLEVAGQVLIAEATAPLDDPVATRRRAVATSGRILRMSLLVGCTAGVAVLALRTALPHLFTGDAAVAAVAASGLWWVALAQPLNSVVFALDGILVGADDLRYTAMAMTSVGALYGIGAAGIVATGAPLTAVWALLVSFMAGRGAFSGARVAWSGWPPPGAVRPTGRRSRRTARSADPTPGTAGS